MSPSPFFLWSCSTTEKMLCSSVGNWLEIIIKHNTLEYCGYCGYSYKNQRYEMQFFKNRYRDTDSSTTEDILPPSLRHSHIDSQPGGAQSSLPK